MKWMTGVVSYFLLVDLKSFYCSVSVYYREIHIDLIRNVHLFTHRKDPVPLSIHGDSNKIHTTVIIMLNSQHTRFFIHHTATAAIGYTTRHLT